MKLALRLPDIPVAPGQLPWYMQSAVEGWSTATEGQMANAAEIMKMMKERHAISALLSKCGIEWGTFLFLAAGEI
jgi:hypothetical protein